MVVFRQSGCIRPKVVVFGQSCCTREGCFYSGKILVLVRNLLDMGLINKVDMVCLSPVGYGV